MSLRRGWKSHPVQIYVLKQEFEYQNFSGVGNTTLTYKIPFFQVPVTAPIVLPCGVVKES